MMWGGVLKIIEYFYICGVILYILKMEDLWWLYVINIIWYLICRYNFLKYDVSVIKIFMVVISWFVLK